MNAIAGIVVVAAAATLGDLIWYSVGVRHTMTAGLLHGALLLAVLGGVLGAASGRLVKGLPIGALAGIGGALSYYGLIPGAWVIMWLLLATLEGRWLRAPDRRRWSEIAIRGVVAAVVGGVAFALVRTVLWGSAPGEGRNYLVQFAAWTFAWAPGVLALTWRNKNVRASVDREPHGARR